LAPAPILCTSAGWDKTWPALAYGAVAIASAPEPKIWVQVLPA
jgi:hypothetical protein